MKVGITGASGLIGTALTEHLTTAGHDVTAFVRSTRPSGDTSISWSPNQGILEPGDVAALDAVVHLAGAGIGDHRWTASYRNILRESRLDGTGLISRTIADLGTDGPATLISASAIGFYGDRGDERLDETSEPGTGFLTELCQAWEAATAPASDVGTRVVHLRTGIVLSAAGGALGKMLPLFKLGLGGRFGSGEQWMSWISLGDHLRAIEHLLQSSVSGPVNLTAPHPVRNREFVSTLGETLRRPTRIPVPSFGPRLLLGSEAADALLFEGQHVTPTVLLRDGFEFEHAELAPALASIVH